MSNQQTRHWVVTLSCPDQPGIVRAVAEVLANTGGNITESQQFGAEETGLFFMRVQVQTPAAQSELQTALDAVARHFDMNLRLDEVGRPVRTLILGSTTEHCVSDLLFRQRSGRLPIEVAGLVSNHEVLRPLANFYDAPFHHIPVTADTKAAAEDRLLQLVEDLEVELVVMARYMQILSKRVTEALEGQVINIHHSFLPSFKGARPYAQAHYRGVKLIGATAHYATADLDEGPIIEQDVERVSHSEPVAELQAIGQDVERRVLARAVRWHAEHRVLLDGHRTVVFR